MNKLFYKVSIKQLKSTIKCSKKQKLTLKTLALKKINDQVEHIATPQILGIIKKVKHLIEVKKI